MIIVSLITNGNNVALISPRRLGKTDLLKHCFEQGDLKETYYTFIIDIYSTKSLTEMVDKLGRSILKTLQPKGESAWNKFLSALKSIRSGISYDAAGVPSWTLELGEIKNPSVTLDEIFGDVIPQDVYFEFCREKFVQAGKGLSKDSASSVMSAVNGLLDKGILTKNRSEYFVYDHFLKFWLNGAQSKD